ncbi:MAG: hypothetical protein ACLTE2_07885 [Eubacteriales bacterium]
MKAKLFHLMKFLERMKTGNIKNICIVDFLTAILKTYRLRKWALLVRDREDSIFIQAELDGE